MLKFISQPSEPKPTLISEYWVHFGSVLRDTDELRSEIMAGRTGTPFNRRNFVYRHIFDLNLRAIGWDALPEDHLLVNFGQGLQLSPYALAWAKRNNVKWIYRTIDDDTWIEVRGGTAAMKVKLRWS